jgi:glyoxylase-like metal-dependent hydrolase (beta-lactamase superfamily II)
MEVFPHIHRLEAPLGDRVLCVYLLVHDGQAVLVDTGLDATPREVVVPYLKKIRLTPRDVTRAVISHADFDHFGGNAAWHELFPDCEIRCHPLDRPAIEDVDVLLGRYGEFAARHGIKDSPEVIAWIRQVTRACPVTSLLSEGDTIRLGAQTWQVWHTPGHTPGHLTLYEPRQRIAIIQDAALGATLVTRDGAPAFPPTYRFLKSYRATLERFSRTPIDALLTAHYPVMRADAAAAFIQESKTFVDDLESALIDELKRAPVGRTLRELIAALAPRVGNWPAAAWNFLAYPLMGHLEAMVDERRIVCDQTQSVFSWRICAET